jgi:hypothetical protein
MLHSPLGLLGVLSLPAPVLELRICRLGASALDTQRTRTRRKRLGTVYLALRIFINIKLRLFSLSLFSFLPFAALTLPTTCFLKSPSHGCLPCINFLAEIIRDCQVVYPISLQCRSLLSASKVST